MGEIFPRESASAVSAIHVLCNGKNGPQARYVQIHVIAKLQGSVLRTEEINFLD